MQNPFSHRGLHSIIAHPEMCRPVISPPLANFGRSSGRSTISSGNPQAVFADEENPRKASVPIFPMISRIYFFPPQSPPKKRNSSRKQFLLESFRSSLTNGSGFPPLVNHHQGIPRYLPRPLQPVEDAPKEEGAGRGRGARRPHGAGRRFGGLPRCEGQPNQHRRRLPRRPRCARHAG